MAGRMFDISVIGVTPAGYYVTLETKAVDGDKLKELVGWIDERLSVCGIRANGPTNNHESTKNALDLTAPTCAIHNAVMELHTKGTSKWYSHKVIGPDGTETWCRGK